MELFIKECHEKQKLVVHGSAIPSMSLEEFRREALHIDQLKQYGMSHYLIDTIEGPGPILRYLCQTIKIHTLPIANESAMSQIESITKDGRIRRFFVKNFFVNICSDEDFCLLDKPFITFSTRYPFRITQMKCQRQTFMFKKKDISLIVSIINKRNSSKTS